MKFRKKPVVIDAVQWNGNNKEEIMCFCGDRANFITPPNEEGSMYIKTLEGTMRSNVGDWIIRGVRGEFYSCKEDIFYETYESVEDMSTPYPKIYDPRQKEGTITNISEDSLGGITRMVSHNPSDPWAYGLDTEINNPSGI